MSIFHLKTWSRRILPFIILATCACSESNLPTDSNGEGERRTANAPVEVSRSSDDTLPSETSTNSQDHPSEDHDPFEAALRSMLDLDDLIVQQNISPIDQEDFFELLDAVCQDYGRHLKAIEKTSDQVNSEDRHVTSDLLRNTFLDYAYNLPQPEKQQALMAMATHDPSLCARILAEIIRLVEFERRLYHHGPEDPALLQFPPAGRDNAYAETTNMWPEGPSALWPKSVGISDSLNDQLTDYDLRFYQLAELYLLVSQQRGEEKLKEAFNDLLMMAGLAATSGPIATMLVGDATNGDSNRDISLPILLDANRFFTGSTRADLRRECRDARRLNRLDYIDLQILVRIENIEQDIDTIRGWMEQTDLRLTSIESGLRNAQVDIQSLQEQYTDLNDRVFDLEIKVEFMDRYGTLGGQRTRQMPANADNDKDGLNDRVEDLLLQTYAPTLMMMTGERPPTAIDWWVRHSVLKLHESGARWERDTWINDPQVFVDRYLASGVAKKCSLTVEDDAFLSGQSDPAISFANSDWRSAERTGNQGVYGHVVPGNDDCSIAIVQYFVFFSYNETAYTGYLGQKGSGNHEGDWGMVSFWVKLPTEARNGTVVKPDSDPPVSQHQYSYSLLQNLLNTASGQYVLCARMTNHGRYIDVRGSYLDWHRDGERLSPRVYIEEGTHEAWPNAGGRGYGGWPIPVPGDQAALTYMTRTYKQRDLTDHDVGPIAPWSYVGSNRYAQSESDRRFFLLVDPDSIGEGGQLNHPLYRDGRKHRRIGRGIIQLHDPFFRPPWAVFDPNDSSHLVARLSFDFGLGQSGTQINEHKVVRRHFGTRAYVTRDIPNLGEPGHPQAGLYSSLIFDFEGQWGSRGGMFHGDPPLGPKKEEMWIGHYTAPAANIDPRFLVSEPSINTP